MKKTISILTATRAEYGLLKPIIEKFKTVDEIDVKLVVTGAHLSPEFGLTYQEIEADGNMIDEKIEILLSGDSPSTISKAMGLAMISFADYFARIKPDMLVVLGDRYETLAVSIAAMNQNIPIAHLYGGETTEGAIDECIRHAITKLSYLHFTSTDEYKRRVIQLGESPSRVFNVGGIGIENIQKADLMSKDELAKSLKMDLDKPYAVVTFHPVTLESDSAKKQITQLLESFESFDMNFLVTKANADASGRSINSIIDVYEESKENIFAFTSLGMIRYLSSLKYCELVIGNSSSGLLEAPSFKIPTINIGDRQKGRMQATSVINCRPFKDDIIEAIQKGMSNEFKASIIEVKNPYGDGNTSEKIVDTIKEVIVSDGINLKKSFFDNI